jgi:hypothetical protein
MSPAARRLIAKLVLLLPVAWVLFLAAGFRGAFDPARFPLFLVIAMIASGPALRS